MNELQKVSVLVQVTPVSDNNISVEILFPPEQDPIPLVDAAHILAAGISLIIKSCNKYENGKKDYELIKEIIDHLNNEFVSTEAFEDVKAIVNIPKEENE
jgi:hypothetical protein